MALKVATLGQAEQKVRIVTVEGDVDMESSPTLRNEITRQLKADFTLKINLSAVRNLDSPCVAVLAEGFKAARKLSEEHRLVRPSPGVKAVIDLAQLGYLFTIEEGEG